MTVRLLAVISINLLWFSCGEESEGGGSVPVPVFGADQTIAQREISTIDAVDAKSEFYGLSALYAPENNGTSDGVDDSDSECDFGLAITAPSVEELKLTFSANATSCPTFISNSSSLSEYDFQFSGEVGFYCQGADFTSLAGAKTLPTAMGNYGCDPSKARTGSRSRMYMYLKLGKSNSDGTNQVFLTEMDMESSNKGEYCLQSVDAKDLTVMNCKEITWSQGYFGDAANLGNPYDFDSKRTSGPKKIRTEVIKQGLSYQAGDLFYRSGAIRATVNQWTTTVNYEDPFHSPYLTINSGEESLSFTLPQQRPGDDAEATGIVGRPMQTSVMRQLSKAIYGY